MSQRLIRWMAMLAVVLAVVACAKTDPEIRLRESLGAMQAAIEARDTGSIDDLLADDFIGPDAMDRDAARRLAQVSFLRFRDVGLRMGPPDIAIAGDRATVRFSAALTGGSGGLLPDSADLKQVRTAWREEGGDWKLISAEWTDATR